jgi:hypothetical protein
MEDNFKMSEYDKSDKSGLWLLYFREESYRYLPDSESLRRGGEQVLTRVNDNGNNNKNNNSNINENIVKCDYNFIAKHSWTSLSLKMGQIGSPETSVSNHLTPRNKPEDRRISFNCGGSLRF